MFKSSKRKIVAAIMSVLTFLWVGTLCVIYISSYSDVKYNDREMLKEHATLYVLNQHTDIAPEPIKPFPNKGPHSDTDRFKLSTFYSVALSYDGSVLEIRNDKAVIYTDKELEEAAKKAVLRNAPSGEIDDLIYYKVDKNGYILVAFMDNTIIHESMNTLFRYTLIFGGVALVCLFFLAVYLAKRIVDPLEESYKKQKQFVSDAGHELKTPVSVISANSELLSREIGENQWLSNIQYEAARMGTLVGQLLELARSENVTEETEELDMSHLVKGEVLPFEAVLYEQALTLYTDISDGLIIQGDAAKIKQLVAILLDNAVKHSAGGNEVWLTLQKEHGYAKLSVKNRGEEIKKEDIPQLFDRFYRVDTVRNSDSNHYGLGLAIAKAIATSHKGKIGVECFDGFVEFSVTIPLI